MSLPGNKLAGGNPKKDRVENDFYATDPKAVYELLKSYSFDGVEVLEPCVGQGHIAKAIKDFYTNKRNITGVDIVERGYPNTIVHDFLTWEPGRKFEAIITNPPYSLATEFVKKGISLLTDETENTCNGQMAMFLKIQFLEGQKRKELFDKFPPKYIFVFRNRMATWNDGKEFDVDENTGKKKRWATTICHAWFVWEKGFCGDPVIKWL